MQQSRWETPNKARKCDSPRMNSPRLYMTPVKQNEIYSKHTAYQDNAGHFTVLPSHITPPSRLTKIYENNPFETNLTDRLHLSTISPTIFTKVQRPLQSPEFKWSIDELAQMQPVKIEEFPKYQLDSPDPVVEMRAQAAIDNFFKRTQVIPSPWENRDKESKSSMNMDTPSRPLDDFNSTKEQSKVKKDAWSQTVLTLPIDLPQTVERVLESYFTFTQEQNEDEDDINLSNSSLRRKLFFNHNEHNNDENESNISLSSVDMDGSMILSCSPPQSGMFVHHTIKESPQSRRQSGKFANLPSPLVSPIHNDRNNVLCKRDSIVNMSIDLEKSQKFDNDDNNDDLLDICSNANNMQCTEDSRHQSVIISHEETNLYASGIRTKYTDPIDSAMSDSVILNDRDYNAIRLKLATERENNSIHKSGKQNDTMFNASDPQDISNSIQDTGYQTYSMNNTTHIVDICNSTSFNQNIHSCKHMVTCKDDTHLSWKEDMSNVFSSTPSKHHKRKES